MSESWCWHQRLSDTIVPLGTNIGDAPDGPPPVGRMVCTPALRWTRAVGPCRRRVSRRVCWIDLRDLSRVNVRGSVERGRMSWRREA